MRSRKSELGNNVDMPSGACQARRMAVASPAPSGAQFGAHAPPPTLDCMRRAVWCTRHCRDDASSSQAAGTKRPYDGSGPAQAAVKLESHSLGMAPEGLPVLGAVPAVAGAPRMMAMPALQHLQSLQHMVNLQQAGMQGARLVAPGPGQAPVLMHMVTPHQYAAALAAQTAQQNSAAFAAAARPPAATAVLAATAAPPALHGVPAAAAPPQPQPGPRIPQSDGPGDDDGDDEGERSWWLCGVLGRTAVRHRTLVHTCPSLCHAPSCILERTWPPICPPSPQVMWGMTRRRRRSWSLLGQKVRGGLGW